ncbi:MarR family transcriptional regulator [Pseudarthrobacter sp. NamE2]|uniref:MarR family transcriptional regulator n=1 Tax=Pseudarthrobacter sp. NamE2 TaxID=2576838 RepID=UPI0010FD76F7|nr:MarR family transcriptional regulator [Pseudarthrobacter sp. NamE2]TLM81989.1 MarR family transcriptional regulator [Pseudarthrobacter sp. NamE2]
MRPSVSAEILTRATRERITTSDVLNALSEFRAAETSMLRRTRSMVDRAATDALALRYLRDASATGEGLRPTELAIRLGLSSASVTALVDRLVSSGAVRREPHPVDRRAVILRVTKQAEAAGAGPLDHARRPLADVIASLDQEELSAVMKFITRMRDAMNDIERVR